VPIASNRKQKPKLMDIKTKDHPEANGRKPIPGDTAYTFTFIDEHGTKVNIHMGEEGWKLHSQHVLDMLAETPSYDDGSLDKH
jgi:hypothetical protein